MIADTNCRIDRWQPRFIITDIGVVDRRLRIDASLHVFLFVFADRISCQIVDLIGQDTRRCSCDSKVPHAYRAERGMKPA